MQTYDVIVIGGGQAGLTAGYHLQRANLKFLILEGGEEPTGSWKQYYDSLKLFSPTRYSSLPGMAFPGNPNRYPTRDEVVDYLRGYARHFQLPIQTGSRVECVEHDKTAFRITTRQGAFSARHIIVATGAFNHPHIPHFEGHADYAGEILHSSQYRAPDPFKAQRILIIGAGNSAVQIAVELANIASVTLTSRHPIQFSPQRILGRDVHFWLRISGFDTFKRSFEWWSPKTISAPSVPDMGVYRKAFQTGNPLYRPMFKRFTQNGVQWQDGAESPVDTVIFATGFRPNTTFLAPLNALDEDGNALHQGGISTATPRLYYVGISGQRSFASATLRGVGEDAAYVVRHITR